MSYSEEIEQAKKIEERASNQLKNEMELYFQTYEYWKKTMNEAGFENSTITITRKKT